MLTHDEIRTYYRDGWVIPQGFRLSEAEVPALRGVMDQIQAENPGILPDRLSNPHLEGAAPHGVRG